MDISKTPIQKELEDCLRLLAAYARGERDRGNDAQADAIGRHISRAYATLLFDVGACPAKGEYVCIPGRWDERVSRDTREHLERLLAVS